MPFDIFCRFSSLSWAFNRSHPTWRNHFSLFRFPRRYTKWILYIFMDRVLWVRSCVCDSIAARKTSSIDKETRIYRCFSMLTLPMDVCTNVKRLYSRNRVAIAANVTTIAYPCRCCDATHVYQSSHPPLSLWAKLFKLNMWASKHQPLCECSFFFFIFAFQKWEKHILGLMKNWIAQFSIDVCMRFARGADITKKSYWDCCKQGRF